jgi:GNAT superfamily N-acetyltransferase
MIFLNTVWSFLSIGKIKVEYSDNYAFIYGFGILPDSRGKGYGRAALFGLHSLIRLEIP